VKTPEKKPNNERPETAFKVKMVGVNRNITEKGKRKKEVQGVWGSKVRDHRTNNFLAFCTGEGKSRRMPMEKSKVTTQS